MNEKSSATQIAEEKELTDVVLNFVGQFINLNEEEKQAIVESIQPKSFKKGDYLLKEGQIPTVCYFILKGCVRQFYLKDGEERTTNFYLEGDAVDPLNPINQNAPSKYYLQCIEDCVLSIGGSNVEDEMFKNFPKFEMVCRVATETKLAKTTEQLSNFIISSPEERYLNLIENRPELLNRVPQYQLASYLGMKPESLSRIRKRILKKK